MNISFSSLDRLNRWESFRFLHDVLAFIDSHAEGMPELFVSKLESFRTAFDAYDDALVQERQVAPEKLVQAEEGRDLAIRKLYALIDEHAEYPYNKEKEDAAKVLLNVFKPYGSGSYISRLAQDEETAMLINLLQDLVSDTSHAEAIQTLGLIEVQDALSTHNTVFARLQKQRTKDNAHTILGIVKATRTQAQKEFVAFVEVVNAFALIEGEEKYAELKLEINRLHKEVVDRAKQRTNKKEDETEQTVEA